MSTNTTEPRVLIVHAGRIIGIHEDTEVMNLADLADYPRDARVCSEVCAAAAPDLLANLKATLQQLEDAKLTHEQVCNGVHADSGTCEGEYIYARFLQHTRDLIATAEGTNVSSRSP